MLGELLSPVFILLRLTLFPSHALQLRQAKLSFPSVRLLVGVLPDECNADSPTPTCPHIERCELLRHCRWVDEVIPDAPPVLDEQFLLRHRIDFVAVEEGISLDPACDKVRVKGYEYLRELGEPPIHCIGRS